MAEHEWMLTSSREAVREHWRTLPQPPSAQLSRPQGYLPSAESIEAANLALALGQPLILTGEPGCGKTVFADWLAYKLDVGQALKFQTKSTSVARELFYNFDAVGRFHAAQTGSDSDPRRFVNYQALGEAIIRALGAEHAASFVSPDRLPQYQERPTRSVVLIDEIDKANRDFPNDILSEIEKLSFEIPELSKRAAASLEFLPVIIVTSNAERGLPEAFLRRCLFHHLSFPSTDKLMEIVASRVSEMTTSSRLVNEAVEILTLLRRAFETSRWRPGTAELLGFINAIRLRGYGPDDTLKGSTDWHRDALTTMVKTADKQEDGRAILKRFTLLTKA